MLVVEFRGAEKWVPAFAGTTVRSIAHLFRFVLLALFLLALPFSARADGLSEAIAGLGGDSFAAKEKAVIALAKSGEPRAALILQALAGDRLRKAPDGRVVIIDTGRGSAKLDRCRDGPASRRSRAGGSRPHHREQPAARHDRGGARDVDPVQPGSRGKARRRPGRAASSLGRYRSVARKVAGGRAGSRDPRRDAAQPRRLAALRRQQGRAAGGDPHARQRHRSAGEEPARRVPLHGQYRSRALQGRRGGARFDRQPAALDRDRRQFVSGHQPRQRAAAGRDRARDHLRCDGRHQHGAWRDDHDRRLCRLCRAAAVPRVSPAGSARRLPARRGAGGVPVRWAAGRAARTLPDPVSVRPAARDTARHLGRQPHSAAGGTLDVRLAEQGGGEPELDDRRVRCRRRFHGHLQPALHHRFLLCRARVLSR